MGSTSVGEQFLQFPAEGYQADHRKQLGLGYHDHVTVEFGFFRRRLVILHSVTYKQRTLVSQANANVNRKH